MANESNSAPGAPELVWPSSGATISGNAVQVFTIRASDPDGDPYRGSVRVSDAETGRLVFTFGTAPAPSGQQSSGSPGFSFARGSYTWTASATDIHNDTGPQAESQPFTVAGSLGTGGGAVAGSVSFTQPIPPAVDTEDPFADQPCAQTSFSLSAFSAAGVISFAQTAFAGPVILTGSGEGSCETAGLGAGSLELSAQGLGVASSTLDCPMLSGSYTRVGTNMDTVVSGPCTINGFSDSVTLDFSIELVPTSGGGAQPISEASFDGAFVVAAAM